MSQQPPSTPPSIPPASPPDAPHEDESSRGGVADFVRRAVSSGVGALFTTEEQVRRAVGDLKLPKELLGSLAGQAERTRAEFSGVLRKELRRFLNSDAFKAQLLEMLSGVTLEVKAEVRLKPSPDIAKLDVRLKGTEKAVVRTSDADTERDD